MTTTDLLEVLDALGNAIDPRTGVSFERAASPLANPSVRRKLQDLKKAITFTAEDALADISDALISRACADLRELGYAPSVVQLVKIFIGSRSIADHSLKAVAGYNQYRGVYTRPVLHTRLVAFARRFPDQLPEVPGTRKPTAPEPWRRVDFFRTEPFDKLEPAKASELQLAVSELGLRKPTERLPAYMATARQNYPRAFEPWTRDEKALLIEAMCYTNQLERLSPIFGRAARSLETTGQRLIYDSQGRGEGLRD